MVSIEPVSHSPAPNMAAEQIWRSDNEGYCRGKVTKLRFLAAGALAGCAALSLGLYFGLTESASGGDFIERIVGQATDPNAVGCYKDERSDRVFKEVLSSVYSMTPAVCSTYCEFHGFFYYALEWGRECWCGDEDVDVTVHGEGECDFACSGDSEQICGGYLSFTVYEVGQVSTTPTPTPAGVSCGDEIASVRFTSTTIYLEGGGCATLTDVYNAQSEDGSGDDGPLYILDADDNVITGADPTGYWLVARDMRIVDGVTFVVHGKTIGGDADVLRIQSNGEDDFYEIRGHGGSLSFKSTTVTSWDTENGEEQTTYEGGRSFLNCISEVIDGKSCAKNDMGECRMDIIDSVMGNMGWYDGESYGLTWKVRGFCTDKSNPEVFDTINVYGDIQGSEIYGMYYGMYSYGHQGGVWTDNVMRDNILYGFDPHDDSDYITIADNTIYGNGNHGIIGSKRCNNMKIYNNEVYNGGEGAAGIFLHRSSDDAEVYGNHVHDMQDAGIAFLESMDAVVYNNVFENVKYGVRLSLGSSGNNFYENSFDTCTKYGFYTYMGSDEPDYSDGRPNGNIFNMNIVSNTPVGVKIKEADNTVLTNNIFTKTDTLEFEDSSDTEWSGNTIPSNACVDGDRDFTSDSDSLSSC